MQQPALEKVCYGPGDLRGYWAVAIGFLMAGTAGEGNPHAVPGHEARVLERATPQIPGQIRHHPRAVAVALPNVHVPLGLLRVAKPGQQVEPRLRPDALR
jgi:hypothetical protein